MNLRIFQPGDDVAQLVIYNTAAAQLPHFKPATLDEIRRRCAASDFDPATRLYAIEAGQPVAYATFADSGRIGYPWCLPGHEAAAEPLLAAVLDALRTRGLTTAWTAYRGDWQPVGEFLTAHGFRVARRMLNYVLDLVEMPTPAASGRRAISPLRPDDLPELLSWCPGLLRVSTPAALEGYLFHNPYFSPESLFALRDGDGRAVAAAILIVDSRYADPKKVDAQMPCFRLGAWGTEGLTHKRINGLISILVPPTGPGRESGQQQALDLLTTAAVRLADTDISTLAAQVSDDQEHLARFYRSYFRAQGSFPIYQREL